MWKYFKALEHCQHISNVFTFWTPQLTANIENGAFHFGVQCIFLLLCSLVVVVYFSALKERERWNGTCCEIWYFSNKSLPFAFFCLTVLLFVCHRFEALSLPSLNTEFTFMFSFNISERTLSYENIYFKNWSNARMCHSKWSNGSNIGPKPISYWLSMTWPIYIDPWLTFIGKRKTVAVTLRNCSACKGIHVRLTKSKENFFNENDGHNRIRRAMRKNV